MRRYALVSLAILGSATACGGGGSGGGSEPVAITSDNAEVVASDVLAAIAQSADLSTIGGGLAGALFPSAAGAAEPADDSSLRALAAALRVVRTGIEPAPSLPGGVAASQAIGPITVDCETGTATVSANVAGSLPAAGDRVQAHFDACVLVVDGETLPELNGDFSYRVAAFVGDPDALFSNLLAITFDAFAIGTGTEREQIDGSANVAFNNTSQPDVISSAQGSHIEFSTGTGESLTLEGFATQLVQDGEDEDYQVSSDGQVSSSAFDGVADYSVSETLEGELDDEGETENPDRGAVLVLGDTSSMTIDVVDATNVDLLLDLDDDGTDDETIHTTWADLGF